MLRDLETDLIELPIPTPVWELAFETARKARSSGVTAPATDILIAACAAHHGATLEHADADFDWLNAVD